MKVAVKYCGSCNPQIDLGPVGRKLRDLAGAAVSFVPVPSGEADLMVILNGCRTACANRPDVRAMGNAVIVVAAETVDLDPVPEREIAARLARMILSRV